jgi:hypothetical protein
MTPKASRDPRGCANMRRERRQRGKPDGRMASGVRAFFHKLGQYKHYFWPTIGVLAVIFCVLVI